MMSMNKTKQKRDLIDMEILEDAAPTMRTLAHPMRLRIIDFLKDGEKSVSEIVGATGKSQALTSHQLGLLRDRGVIKARRDGNHVYYRIIDGAALGLLGCIRRQNAQRNDTGVKQPSRSRRRTTS